MAVITEPRARTGSPGFTRFAWATLVWNLFVILWGAYVRASGSGAGCGSHWPLCNGDVVPRAPRIETIIEFTHRMTSGVAGLAVFALVVWSFFQFPRRHLPRATALLALVFMIGEILIGRRLVQLQLVGDNASFARVGYLSVHLVNTEFLLGALALTAWLSSRDLAGRLSLFVLGTLPVAILVSITGAIAALGDTLFPASSLAQGLHQDLSSNFLLRLRVVHPIMAGAAGLYFCIVAVRRMRQSRIALAVLILTLGQLGAGVVNLLLLAPIPMQITHLLLADLLWISLVLLLAEGERV